MKKIKKLHKVVPVMSVCLAVICGMTTNAQPLNVNYNSAEKSVTVSGTAEKCDYVNIVIKPGDTAKLTETMINNGGIILKSLATDKIYDFSDKIVLPVDFANGEYIVSASGSNCNEDIITVFYDETKFDDVIEGFDKNDTGNMSAYLEAAVTKLELNAEIFAEYKDYISQIMPVQTESDADFLNSYMLCQGIARFKNNDLKLSEMLKLYRAYTGIDRDNYDALDSDKKADVDSLMESVDYSKDKFSNIYADKVVTAQFRCADTYSDAKTLMIDWFKDADKDLSDYNALSEDKKNLVFIELYSNRTDMSSTDDIWSAFKAGVEEQNKPKKNIGGGGVTGGGSSAGRYEVPSDHTQKTTQLIFTDLTGHWAEADVMELYNIGIINGFDDSTFRPDEAVSRAQYAKMISELIGLKTDNTKSEFADVDEASWYAPYINSAAAAGIVQGFDGFFNPDSQITREDAAVILYRVFSYLDLDINGESTFSDIDAASDYAKDIIKVLGGFGIINGFDGKFCPKDRITRAEAAAIINRTAAKIG